MEVAKLRRERALLIRAEHEARATREREAEDRQRQQEQRALEAQAGARAEAQERRRLDALRSYGGSLATIAPADYQAKVARDLLLAVNDEEYPSGISDYLAREQIRARVDEILNPWRDAQERVRAEADSRRKSEALVSAGTWYASTETRDWDRREADRARREVERTLRQEVEPNWTSEDVDDLVDEVLDEWDDD